MERLIFEEEIDTAEQDHEKTLAKMKQKYYVLVKQMTKNNRLNRTLLRREWIDELTKNLLEEEKVVANKGTQSKQLKILSQNYQVKCKNGRNILTVKSKNRKTWDVIVPLENSFETALYAHLKTKHGGTYDMLMSLEKSGIAIAQLCLPIIRQVCQGITKECEKNRGKDFDSPLLPLLKRPCYLDDTDAIEVSLNAYSEESNIQKSISDIRATVADTNKGTNVDADPTDAHGELGEREENEESNKRKRKNDSQVARKSTTTLAKSRKTYVPRVIVKPSKVPAALVNIIDMSNAPDKMYHYLLVYEDFETGFVQLRPLTYADIVVEVTMEIFKIFCDFNPPKCIVINKEFKSIFKRVLVGLKDVIDSSILLEVSDHEIIRDTMSLIDIRLKQWHLAFKSNAWSIGCHTVQWQINSKIANDGSTAHRRFFGINRKNCPEQRKDSKKSDTEAILNSITETSNLFNLDSDSEELNELMFAPLNINQTRPITSPKPHTNPSDNIPERVENNRTEESSNFDNIDSNSCGKLTTINIDSDDEKSISVKSENGEEDMNVGTIHIGEPFSLKSNHEEPMDVETIGIKEPLDNLYPIPIKPEESTDVFKSEENEFDITEGHIQLSERLTFELDNETMKSETEEELTNYVFVINRSDVGSSEPKEKNVGTRLDKEFNNKELVIVNEVLKPREHHIEMPSQSYIPQVITIASVSNVGINNIYTPEIIITCSICQHRVTEPVLCQTCNKHVHSFCGGTHFHKGFCCFRCL